MSVLNGMCSGEGRLNSVNVDGVTVHGFGTFVFSDKQCTCILILIT